MYSLYNYSSMFGDKVRFDAYTAALKSIITPSSTVLDLGAGSGLFSLIACKLGAQKVYAIDPSDCILIGKELAQANGFQDRIKWIQDDSRKVDLPEKVDVLISDIRGALPLIGENISVISDARKRFLKKNGRLLPYRDTLHMALVGNNATFEKAVRPWRSCGKGLSLTPLSKRHAHLWHSCTPKSKHMVSIPKKWASLDYSNLDNPDIENTINLSCDRQATVHGFYLWFDAEIAPGIGFSGGPVKKRPSVYGCGFFPWPTPVKMKAGDRAKIHLQATLVAKEYLWRWRTTIDGSTSIQFDQSTLHADTTSLLQLRKRAHSHVPQLTENGQLEVAVLQLMNGGRNLETIAHKLMAQFPKRFSKYEETLAYVGNISEKFSL